MRPRMKRPDWKVIFTVHGRDAVSFERMRACAKFRWEPRARARCA